MVGLPGKHPAHVVVTLRPIARLAQAPCGDVSLMRDGIVVRPREVVRRDDHRLLLTLPIESLRALEKSTRFSGRACGVEFALDELGRTSLGHFEIRFREELERFTSH